MDSWSDEIGQWSKLYLFLLLIKPPQPYSQLSNRIFLRYQTLSNQYPESAKLIQGMNFLSTTHTSHCVILQIKLNILHPLHLCEHTRICMADVWDKYFPKRKHLGLSLPTSLPSLPFCRRSCREAHQGRAFLWMAAYYTCKFLDFPKPEKSWGLQPQY